MHSGQDFFQMNQTEDENDDEDDIYPIATVLNFIPHFALRISALAPSPVRKCPRPVLRPNGDEMGGGSSPHSLSRADIRRTVAASFPTPFSTASGVIGLVAGPSSVLRRLDS
jgi:hypothetical protein